MSDFAGRIVNRKNVDIGNVNFAPNFVDQARMKLRTQFS
jgi:hypothetical protein